jgi:hypothetical protein
LYFSFADPEKTVKSCNCAKRAQCLIMSSVLNSGSGTFVLGGAGTAMFFSSLPDYFGER